MLGEGSSVKLVIGNKNYSSWSLRAWLLLAFHKVPFEEIRIPLRQESTQATIARYSEAGKVPVLQDGELTIWDSLAICEYVSEQYLDGAGWPNTIRARAQARSCSAEMHSGFQEIRAHLPMNCRATGRLVRPGPALEKELARVDQIWSRCRVEYAADGPWLFGGFSIADCMFAPVVFRFNTYGIGLSRASGEYLQFALNHETMREWERQSRAETETIEAVEVGMK